MKVLFVSNENSKFGISPIIKNQGISLVKNNIDLYYFTIKGKGYSKYITNIFSLRKNICKNNYDIIHAHYLLSGIVASLASRSIPVVVSLMGSDIQLGIFWKIVNKFFYKFRWHTTIVKSKRMKRQLKFSKAIVIPNGVNLERFKPISRDNCCRKLRLDPNKKHILFAANPHIFVKNYQITKSAFEIISNEDIELNYLDSIRNDQMQYYYNANDLVLLTSLWEGSPNVIKEAMACNCPIVSTDVGDVKEIIEDTDGCYVCSYDPKDVAKKINMAINFSKRTNGRKNIQHLDSNIIAKKIINLYIDIIEN